MTALSNLLKSENSEMGGLQDLVLGQRNQWVHPNSQFIQFLHVNDNHWITVSNVGELETNSVNIHDSLGMKPSSDTVNKIAQYMKSDSECLTLKVQPTQQQENGYDCGVMAIAYGTSLAYNQDPSKITYINPRDHLLKCLSLNRITPFPSHAADHGGPLHVETVDLGCFCRGITKDLPVVRCNLCSLLCQVKCVLSGRIPRNWVCHCCSKFK